MMGLAFIPIYVKYLGVESYGLIGLFGLLNAWLVMFDMGLAPALSREMARYIGGEHTAKTIKDLLRSVEAIGFGVGIFISIVIWLFSDWIAVNWVKSEHLSANTVSQAIVVMGIIIGLRILENIYRSGVIGLQKQIKLNFLAAIMATFRGFGAVVVVYLIPTVGAFFVWQGIISFITLVIYAVTLNRMLPAARASFSLDALKSIRKFSGSMFIIAFLALLITQIDKLLLSRMLTLEEFGYYALAGTIVSALYMLPGSIATAIYPRFVEMVSSSNSKALISYYHKGSQLTTVLMGSSALVLIFFGGDLILIWTGSNSLAIQIAPLVRALALGALLNGLLWIPYQLQIAHGWTSLALRTNLVSIFIAIPSIIWATENYGAIGAAWVWVFLNCCYFFATISLMHHRLLTGEKWRWYFRDVGLPMLVGLITTITLRMIAPNYQVIYIRLFEISFIAAIILTSMALTMPAIRERVFYFLKFKIFHRN